MPVSFYHNLDRDISSSQRVTAVMALDTSACAWSYGVPKLLEMHLQIQILLVIPVE